MMGSMTTKPQTLNRKQRRERERSKKPNKKTEADEKLGLFDGAISVPPSPTFGKGTPKVEPNGSVPDDLSDREQVSKFVSSELQKAL